MERIRELKGPLALLIFLQIFDFATTLLVLSMGGREGNPLVQYFFTLGPVPALVLTKVIVIILGLICAYLGRRRGLRTANWVYTAIALWNVSIIVRMSVAATA